MSGASSVCVNFVTFFVILAYNFGYRVCVAVLSPRVKSLIFNQVAILQPDG